MIKKLMLITAMLMATSIWSEVVYLVCEDIKKTITNPDPADIPNKYGLAKPFLSIPCKRAPDIPREEPTNKEAINLGNLSSQIIV